MLKCDVRNLGRPEATKYHWYKGNMELLVHSNGDTLTIPSVGIEQKLNNYTCKAKNAAGYGENATISIDVHGQFALFFERGRRGEWWGALIGSACLRRFYAAREKVNSPASRMLLRRKIYLAQRRRKRIYFLPLVKVFRSLTNQMRFLFRSSSIFHKYGLLFRSFHVGRVRRAVL